MRMHCCQFAGLLVAGLSLSSCGGAVPEPLEPAPLPPAPSETQTQTSPAVPIASSTASAAPAPSKTETAPSGEVQNGASEEPDAAPSAQPSATAGKQEMQGTIAAHAGKALTLQIAGVASTAAGAKGELYRRFGQNLGTLKLTGWLDVAEVVVRKVQARQVVVEIVQEKSDIRVNGKRVDHFAPGETIKLELR